MSYTIPTVNVVVSFDPKIMIEFQKASSFSVFKKNVKEDESTQFFDNGPNSTLISLKHNYIGDKKEGNLVIEVIDPEQNSLSTLTNLSTSLEDALELEGNLDKKLIKDERDKMINQKSGPITFFGNGTIGRPTTHNAPTPSISKDKLYSKNENFIPKEGEVTPSRYDIVNKLYELQTTPMQRPVYIAYGVGEDFNHWCTVKSFGRVLRVEYSFTSTGVKTLKFIFSPIQMFPTLTGLGLHPLGHLADNLKTIGLYKYRIFNKDDFEAQKQVYLELVAPPGPPNAHKGAVAAPASPLLSKNVKKEEVEDFFSDYSDPSLFLIIRDTIKDFIKTATGKKNVLVALPDLDILLNPKLRELEQELINQMTSQQYSLDYNTTPAANAAPRKLDFSSEETQLGAHGLSPYKVTTAQKAAALQSLLELIGFKIITLPPVKNASAIVNTTAYSSQSSITASLFTQMRLKPVIECDYTLQTVSEKLESIGDKITEIVNEFKGVDLKFTKPYVEVNYNIISTLKDFDLIDNKVDPLIIWGEDNFILNFVEARIMEKPIEEIDTSILEHLKNGTAPNLMFRLEGVNKDYLSKLIKVLNPNSGKSSLGGRASNAFDFIDAFDDDLFIDSKEFRHDTPVFLFGVPYPNVLSFDLDHLASDQYIIPLNSIMPVRNNAEKNVGSLIPTGFGGEFNKLFKTWDSQKITDEFKEICDTFVGKPVNGGNNLINFDEWAKIIKDSGGDDLTGGKVKLKVPSVQLHDADLRAAYASNPDSLSTPLPDSSDRDVSVEETELKEAYYTFMYSIFSHLFLQHEKETLDAVGKNIKIISGKQPEIGAMSYLNQVVQTLNQLTLIARVKSIPMFNLSNSYVAINRACVVYCRESGFAGVNGEVPEYTWFSGIYNMMGYTHTITKSSVESEFLLTRTPQSITTKNEEKEKSRADLFDELFGPGAPGKTGV